MFVKFKKIWILPIVLSSIGLGLGLQAASLENLVIQQKVKQILNTNTSTSTTTTTNRKLLLSIFSNKIVANAIYERLYPNSIYDVTSIDQLFIDPSKIEELTNISFKDMNLTSARWLEPEPNSGVTWKKLQTIDISKNDFSKEEVRFKKSLFPALQKIIAVDSKLVKPLDLSTYVEDHNDQIKNETQYTTPISSGAPNILILRQNKIRNLPKYYLKIKWAHLDFEDNLLGSPTSEDPMGYYAIPHYSMKQTSLVNTLGIKDSEIRGPYGIDLYKLAKYKNDIPSNGFLYTEQQVQNWRQSPFPIKSLEFLNSYADPEFPKIQNVKPFFNFDKNQLINIPIFQQTSPTTTTEFNRNSLNINSYFDSRSSLDQQHRTTSIFVGQNDYKDFLNSQGKIGPIINKNSLSPELKELIIPKPDHAYPAFFDYGNNYFTKPTSNDNLGFLVLPGAYVTRSFNGDKYFGIYGDKNSPPIDFEPQIKNQISDDDEIYDLSPNNKTLPSMDKLLNTQSSKMFGSKLDAPLTFDEKPTIDPDNTKNYYEDNDWIKSYIWTPRTWSKKTPTQALKITSPERNIFWDPGFDSHKVKTNFSPRDYTITGWEANEITKRIRFYEYEKIKSSISVLKDINRDILFTYSSGEFYKGIIPGSYRHSAITNLTTNNNKISTRHNSFQNNETLELPFKSQINYSIDGFDYQNSYHVIDNIKSEFQDSTKFNNDLKSVTNDFKDNQELNKYKDFFPHIVTAATIKNGQNTFWKSDLQFDQMFMQNLDKNAIELDYSQLGKLKYKFKVYSPGYNNNGRLLPFNNLNNVVNSHSDNYGFRSKTIDIDVVQTVTGFATPVIQAKYKKTKNDNAAFNDTKDVEYNTDIGYFKLEIDPNESSFSGKKINEITTNDISEIFKTNIYLPSVKDGKHNTSLEKNKPILTKIPQEFITIQNSNSIEGNIIIQINIPKFIFSNGNVLKMPSEYYNNKYKLIGFPKKYINVNTHDHANVNSNKISGINYKKFNVDSLANGEKTKWDTIKEKAASEVTANDIFDLKMVDSNLDSWLKVTSGNANSYFVLTPDDKNGTLTIKLEIAASTQEKTPKFIAVFKLNKLNKKTTKINWKTENQLKKLNLHNLDKLEVCSKFQEDPSQFLNITDPYSTKKLSFNDFTDNKKTFEETKCFEDPKSKGSIQFIDLQLKQFYFQGKKYGNTDTSSSSSSSSTTQAPLISSNIFSDSPNYKIKTTQDSYKFDLSQDNVAKVLKEFFTEDSSAKQSFFGLNNIENNQIESTIKKLSTPELKKMLITFNDKKNSNFLKLIKKVTTTIDNGTSTITETAINENQFNNYNLLWSKDPVNAIEADYLEGKLTINGLKIKKESDQESSTITSNNVIFTPLTTTWDFVDDLPNFYKNLSPKDYILKSNQSNNFWSNLIAQLNKGTKYIDPTSSIDLHSYTVDPAKIEVNFLTNKLKLQSGAIQVSNWIKEGKQESDLYSVDTEKEFTLTNGHSTKISEISNFDNQQLYKQNYNYFLFNVEPTFIIDIINKKSKKFVNAAWEKIPEALKKPITAVEGLKIILQDAKIVTETQKTSLNSLSTSSSVTSSAKDYSNYLVVPEYLYFNNYDLESKFKASTTNTSSDPTSPVLITDKFYISGNSIVINKPIILNSYNKGNKTNATPSPDLIINNWIPAETHIDPTVTQLANGFTKISSSQWKTLTPSQIKAHINLIFRLYYDFYGTAQETLSLNDKIKATLALQEWIKIIKIKNLPKSSVDNIGAFPIEYEADDHSNYVWIKKIIYPQFYTWEFNSTTKKYEAILKYNVVKKVNLILESESNNLPTSNLEKDQAIQTIHPNQLPSKILKGIINKDKTSGAGTGGGPSEITLSNLTEAQKQLIIKEFISSNLLTFIGSKHKPWEDKKPEISATIEYCDKNATITFKDIKIKNGWEKNAQKEISISNSLTFSHSETKYSIQTQDQTNQLDPEDIISFFKEKDLTNTDFQTQAKTQIKQWIKQLIEINNPYNLTNTIIFIDNNKLNEVITFDPISSSFKIKNIKIGSLWAHGIGDTELEITKDNAISIKVNPNLFTYSVTIDFDSNKLLEKSNTTPEQQTNNQDNEIQFIKKTTNVIDFINHLKTTNHSSDKPNTNSISSSNQSISFRNNNININHNPQFKYAYNKILGQVYLDVTIDNYIVKGKNLGRKTFRYTIEGFKDNMNYVYWGTGLTFIFGLTAISIFWIIKYLNNFTQFVIKSKSNKLTFCPFEKKTS